MSDSYAAMHKETHCRHIQSFLFIHAQILFPDTPRRSSAATILYNPHLCRQAGRALCEFYRYRKYGHIELRHKDAVI